MRARKKTPPALHGRYDVDPHLLAERVSEELRKDEVFPARERRTFREIREAVLSDHHIKYEYRPLYRSAIGVILGSRPKRKKVPPRPAIPDTREGLPHPEDDSWFIVIAGERKILVCSGEEWEFECGLDDDGIVTLRLNMPLEVEIGDVPHSLRERIGAIARGHFRNAVKSAGVLEKKAHRRRINPRKDDPRQGTLL